MEITTRDAFIALDPDTITGDDGPNWSVLFAPGPDGLFTDFDQMQARKRLGLDSALGIAANSQERAECYAVACYVVAYKNDPAGDRLRVRACQAIMRGEAKGAWHAVAYVLGKLDACLCFPCCEARKAVRS